MTKYHERKTISIKIPIEIDDYLREFIFKNINMYRHIKTSLSNMLINTRKNTVLM